MGLLLALKLNVTQDTARLPQFWGRHERKRDHGLQETLHCCFRLAVNNDLFLVFHVYWNEARGILHSRVTSTE